MADVDTRPERECLYTLHDDCWDGCWSYSEDRGIYYAGREPGHQCYSIRTWPIIKTTARRVYFRGGPGGPLCYRESTYFIDRAAFDTDGRVYHRRLGDVLYLNRPEVRTHPKPKTVAELRREMADAHPDRGGDPSDFQIKRARYLRAKAASR